MLQILNLLLLLDLYCCVVSGSSNKCLSHWLHGMVVQVKCLIPMAMSLPPHILVAQ